MPDPEPPETTLTALTGSAGGFAAEPQDTGSRDADGTAEADRSDETAEPEAPVRETDGPPVVIVIPGDLVASLAQTYPFSDEIEEGGFLAGTVYRDADRPGGYLVHVTAALPAERTGASMINFTFTGESFLRVSQQLDNRSNNEKLLGWYHTHLFAATSRLGLSSVDVELHRSTFRRPWQVAGLVNIARNRRVLRFYHGEDDQMVPVRYWVVPARGAAQVPATEAMASSDAARDPAPAPEPGPP
jgi:hypothetical protein